MRNFIAMWLAYFKSCWKFVALLFVCVFAYQHLNADADSSDREQKVAQYHHVQQ